jgi:predicted ribosomally synthesized peptide with SipW-like signal peptide
MTSKKNSTSTARKVALSVAATAFAAALIGVGAYAEWSATAEQDQTVTAGDVELALNLTEVSMDASGVAPGDTINRRLALDNTGSIDLSTLTLASTGGASPLFTDTTDGLQVEVQKCTVAWSAAYACTGTATSIYDGPADISPAVDVSADLEADVSGGNDFLLFTVSLPTTAPQLTMEGESVTITYSFDGDQRAGTQK